MSPGRFSTPPLAPEDDWFAESGGRPSAGREEQPLPVDSAIEESHESPRGRGRMHGPVGDRERRLLVAGMAGVLVLLAGGILVARAVTGGDGGGETATPTLQTTVSTPTATPTTIPTTTPATTTPATTTPSAGMPAPLPEGATLRPGDESEDVSQVQAALVELGYSTGGVDGKFGPATEQAVRDFQTDSGLEADGAVGPATLAALSAALNER